MVVLCHLKSSQYHSSSLFLSHTQQHRHTCNFIGQPEIHLLCHPCWCWSCWRWSCSFSRSRLPIMSPWTLLLPPAISKLPELARNLLPALCWSSRATAVATLPMLILLLLPRNWHHFKRLHKLQPICTLHCSHTAVLGGKFLQDYLNCCHRQLCPRLHHLVGRHRCLEPVQNLWQLCYHLVEAPPLPGCTLLRTLFSQHIPKLSPASQN